MTSMNSTNNGGNHGNRGDDFPPPLCNRAGKPYPTRAESEKETATAEKKKRAGRGLIPCPAGGSCGSCRRATRPPRATGLVLVRVLPPTAGADPLDRRRQLDARRLRPAFNLPEAGGFKQRYPR